MFKHFFVSGIFFQKSITTVTLVIPDVEVSPLGIGRFQQWPSWTRPPRKFQGWKGEHVTTSGKGKWWDFCVEKVYPKTCTYIYIYTCYRLFLLFCFFVGILKLIDIKYQRLLKCNLVHWLDWWESCWHGTNMARAVLQSILVSRLQLYADVFAWQWWMGGASCCMLSAIPALEVYFGWVVWCLNTFHLSDSCWSVDECLGFLCCWTDAFGG